MQVNVPAAPLTVSSTNSLPALAHQQNSGCGTACRHIRSPRHLRSAVCGQGVDIGFARPFAAFTLRTLASSSSSLLS